MKIIESLDIHIDIADRERVPSFDIARVGFDGMDEIYGVFLEGRIRAGKDLKRIDFAHGKRRLDRAKVTRKGEAGVVEAAGALLGAKFELGLNLLGAPPAGAIEMHAVFGPADQVRLGSIEVRRRPLPPAGTPRFAPVILNSMGRNGTTWFMHFLAEHPQMYIHPEYPHEMLAAHYWANLLESLSTPLAADRIMGKWAMRDHQMKSVRAHAYYRRGGTPAAALRYLGGAYVEELAAFCTRSVDSVYAALIEADGRDAAQIRYYSEKSLPFPELLKEIYPRAREVFLVRDIRDNICSALAFNRKRGTQEFGRGAVPNDEEFAVIRAREFKALVETYQANRGRACLVRYEDLIREPVATMQRVLAYLELDHGEPLVAAMLQRASRPDDSLDQHKTSASAGSSVERWRRELPAAVQHKCVEVAGGELTALDYPL